MAKFAKISKYENIDFPLPQRKTKYSAGYDFVVVEDTIVPSLLSLNLELFSGRCFDKDFIDKISKTEYVNILKDALSMYSIYERPLINQTELEKAFKDNSGEFIDLIVNQLNLSLDEMKELVKQFKSKLTLVPTGVKLYMDTNEYLQLSIRSSIPLNSYLILANGPGIVDSDYVDNIDNEGHIFFQILNLSPFDITIKKGDIIGQGIILNYNITEDDMPGGERVGGYGSTSK